MEQVIPLITIFTPTYNRRPYLRRLYDSIIRQTFEHFEWVIIDDGSVDGTAEEVNGFIAEGKITLKYHVQENAGKHVAINKGVELAMGELFFIVDSDDMLTPDALDWIAKYWREVLTKPDKHRFAGVCGLRLYQDGTVIGGDVDYNVLDVDSIKYRFNLGYKGDKAEVFRTCILSSYPFPELPGERFCTEALVWNRIAKTYCLRYFNVGIYVCEYLPGGLSDNSVRERKHSPQTACLYYAETAALSDLTNIQRFKAMLNYWRFAVYDNATPFWVHRQAICSPWSYFLYPAAKLLKFLS